MKPKTLVLFFSFMLVGLSCDQNESIIPDQLSLLSPLESEQALSYDQSLIKWQELKDQNGNSYIYQTTFTSWIGMGHTTELKIENGVVTSRIFQEFARRSDGSEDIIDSYREDSRNLGTHEKGADVLTIDQLYEKCATEYLVVDEENNTVFFETSRDGILTICGYVPDQCVDDCFKGIKINAFDWLSK